MTKLISELKTLLLVAGFTLTGTSAMAQSAVTIDASQAFTNFKFTDSKGNVDNSYRALASGAYSLGYRYVSEKGIMFRASLGMRRAGATMVYDASNYSWNLQYADIKLGAGYMYKGGRFSPYLNVSGYYSMLLTAYQVLNNINYDIKNSKSIQNNDFGILVTPGLQFKASDNISVYTEFNYLMGLQNLETGSNGEKSYNRAYSMSLGVAFTITKKESK